MESLIRKCGLGLAVAAFMAAPSYTAQRPAAASSTEKTFIFRNASRDIEQFREYAKVASRLKRYGRVQVDIGVLADRSWYEMPKGGSPWHEYATTHGAMFKFYPHPKIAPFLPADWVGNNRKLLLAKAAILREMGLEAAFSSNDTHFLPEPFFRKYPHLRGPRLDHPRRSKREEFSYCVDHPETLEMIEWMAAELKRNVPEIKTIMGLTNDSGSGLCWGAALYSGPNGPNHCKSRNAGFRVRELMETIHRGFEKGGGKVISRIGGNFWQNEEDVVLPLLPPDTYLSTKDPSSMSLGTMAVEAYPVLGLINPLGLYAAMEKFKDPGIRTVFVNMGPYYVRFEEPVETASRLVDLIEDYIAEPSYGLVQRFDKLRKLATRTAGEQNMKQAFEAFYRLDEAFKLKQSAAPRYSNLYCGVSMRLITRPLLIRPDLLDKQNEAYFLPHVFNIHESEARNDYIDLHGGPFTGPAEWTDAPLRNALRTATSAAATFASLEGAPEQAWLSQLALSLRMWASEVRSIDNFYFGQMLRNRNKQVLEGARRIPEKVGTWTGDKDFIEWTAIQRDELDNASEFLALLEKGGLKYVGHATDPKYEDTFLLGPELPANIKQKIEIMRAHWLDVQHYLASPHK